VSPEVIISYMYITGLLNSLYPEGIICIEFTDDTVLFLDHDFHSIICIEYTDDTVLFLDHDFHSIIMIFIVLSA
jgi:hypothetical protein